MMISPIPLFGGRVNHSGHPIVTPHVGSCDCVRPAGELPVVEDVAAIVLVVVEGGGGGGGGGDSDGDGVDVMV